MRGRGKRLVAEKIETREELAWAREAGYDYSQGFFFARPTLFRGRHIPSVKVNSLRLPRELHHPDLDFGRLESLIHCDISLTYKLFRYVNSARFARSTSILSIKGALVVMGELDIRRWITLATLPGLAAGSPRELMIHAFVRAKFCEMLADAAGIQPASDAFLVGMFGEEIHKLTMQIEELKSEQQQRVAFALAPKENSPSQDRNPPLRPIILILLTGQRLSITNYALMGGVLWDFSNEPAKKIALSSVETDRSIKATEQSGGEFPAIQSESAR